MGATRGVVTLAFNLLLLPSRLMEEAVHALVAWPFADDVTVRIEPSRDRAETRVDYRDGTPEWAVAAAHVAPEVVAGVAGLGVIGWWTVGGATWWPASTLDWVLLWVLGVQWLGLALPEQGSVGGGEDG